MTKKYKHHAPYFKGTKPNSLTTSAYCPECDTIIRKYMQAKCDKCGLELWWNGKKGVEQ